MNVFATTAYPNNPFLDRFLALAAADLHGQHGLTNDADAADLIIFIDPPNVEGDFFLKRIRTHSLWKTHADKCFVYNERDQPFRIFPGIYTSLYAHEVSAARCVACAYLMSPNKFIDLQETPWGAKDLVCSFVGSLCSHPARAKIFELKMPGLYLQDTSNLWMFGDGADFYTGDHETAIRQQKASYAELMRRTQFALCPRGKGPNSIRLFEAMQLGCVPVIIADGASLPTGPKWDDFCLFVKQKDAGLIPAIIDQHRAVACEMGKKARAAYQQFFGERTHFHYLVSLVAGIQAKRGPLDRIFCQRPCSRYLKQQLSAQVKRLLPFKGPRQQVK